MFWFHFGTVGFFVVARLTGRGEIQPCATTSLADRMHMIERGLGFFDLFHAVLAHKHVTQENISFAQAHGAFGFLVFF
jgi:hypothetical protein